MSLHPPALACPRGELSCEPPVPAPLGHLTEMRQGQAGTSPSRESLQGLFHPPKRCPGGSRSGEAIPPRHMHSKAGRYLLRQAPPGPRVVQRSQTREGRQLRAPNNTASHPLPSGQCWVRVRPDAETPGARAEILQARSNPTDQQGHASSGPRGRGHVDCIAHPHPTPPCHAPR